MANSIALVKKYVDKLDDVYKLASLTNGLADYSRSGGYVDGDDKLTWETAKFDYDRGRAFSVDAMDNEETIGISFGMLLSRFVRNKVVPEMDAYRFAKYAGKSGITVKFEAITTGDGVCSAIITANNVLDEAEMDAQNRILFITPTFRNAMLMGFSSVVKVPQAHFYTTYTFLTKDYNRRILVI